MMSGDGGRSLQETDISPPPCHKPLELTVKLIESIDDREVIRDEIADHI